MGRSYIRPRKRRSKPKTEDPWLRRSYQTFEVPATGDAYSGATNVVVAINLRHKSEGAPVDEHNQGRSAGNK
jgi:hypothetical protein